MTELYPSDLPSERQELLKSLIGQRITQLLRYSLYPVDQLIDEYELEPDQLFSFTLGPLVITLESGLNLTISEDISLNSIKISVEQAEAGKRLTNAFELDPDFYPIDALSPYAAAFLHRVPGQLIHKIDLIRRKPANARYEDLPNEVGLVITLDNGEAFIPTRGMYKGLYDFYVISKADVEPEIVSELMGWESD